MEPLKSKPTTVKACTDTVSSKCVIWDGPELTCIDGTKLCKGQSIDTAVYTMATKLCEILEAINIKNYNDCIVSEVPPAKNIRELFDFIIGKVCTIQTEVDDITNAGCPVPTADVPPCLIDYSPGGATTLPVDQYAVMVAGVICTMLTSITNINLQIDSINSQIDDLWAALSNCDKSNQPVQPTCTYDYTVYPDGRPVVIQEAYVWLEAAFCDLFAVIGNSTDITNAINKQCPDLNSAPRLYGGGPMSNIPGWTSNPVSVSDSIGNMWLTVCDMRGALSQVLDTCCFSICNYLNFGYNAIWDVDGTYVDITFINWTTITEANALSTHTNTWSGTVGGPAPAWVTTDFPTAQMTNVIITLNDGTTSVTIDTGSTIYDWLIASNPNNNGYHIDFTDPAFAGYDPTSVNQTITIQFTYQVNDGVTVPQSDCPGPYFCCEIDFTEAFPYECDAPKVNSCAIVPSYPDASSISFTFSGLERETQQYYPIPPLVNATVDTISVNPDELILSTAGWTPGDYVNNIVYIDGGTGAGQCRQIIANNATTLTVFPDWDTPPDLTSTFYIANEYIPLPYVDGGGNSLVNDYVVNIYSAAGFNPNDTSTWVSPLWTTTYTLGLSSATSITITSTSGALVPNTSYVAVIVANYNCGSSLPTLINLTTPIGVIVQLEQSVPIFSAAAGSVDNILSGGLIPSPSAYSVTLSAQATFPIDKPLIAFDSIFNFEMSPGALLTPNVICRCGLLGNPNETDTTKPTYRGNILGDYRGYEVRIEQFDANAFVSVPVYDQTVPPLPYITNSIDDPNLDFTSQPNTPLPPQMVVPVGYNQPYFWIKGVYDPTVYPVNTANSAHLITLLGTSTITFNNLSGAPKTGNPGVITIEVKKWDLSINAYVPYTPARILTLNAYMAGATPIPVGPGTVFTAAALYPALSSRQLFCKVGDALYASVTTAPSVTGGGTTALTRTITVGPSSTVAQQYSCASTTVNSTAVNNSWIITEDYDIAWNFTLVTI